MFKLVIFSSFSPGNVLVSCMQLLELLYQLQPISNEYGGEAAEIIHAFPKEFIENNAPDP